MQGSPFVQIAKESLLKSKLDLPLLALSGGADSWFLFCLLRDLNIPFVPLTLTFEKENYGESEIVQSYAKYLNEEVHFSPISEKEMLAEFINFSRDLGVIIYNLHPISKWLLAKKAIGMGHTHVISGDGADQWFNMEEDCDLYPITRKCFSHFKIELITPLSNEKTWGYPGAKEAIRDYVCQRLPIFQREKIVKLYPDDDFKPLSCLEQSTKMARA